jgi:DNA helicase-2/ATP-dependent DNA helicase PcrA
MKWRYLCPTYINHQCRGIDMAAKIHKILGPPGTGKTTKLISIVEEELRNGTPPERIAYVSFTRKAAREAVVRAMDKFGFGSDAFPYFRTLHSMCFRSLNISSSEIFDHTKIKSFSEWLGIDITGKFSMEEGTVFGNEVGDRCMFLINLARLKCMSTRELYLREYDNISWEIVDRVDRGLKEYKSAHMLMDYTDMIQKFIDNDVVPDVDVVIVDEAQDLSLIQWAMVRKLWENARRIIVAGDDDQAIYMWAGADVNYFIELEGEEEILSKSWRVPVAVQKISNSIVSRIGGRLEKPWEPRDYSGEVVRTGTFNDIDWTHGSVLVLARNRYLLRYAIGHLRASGVPYMVNGQPSISITVASAIKNWEHLRKGNPLPASDIRDVYKYMSMNKGVKRGFKRLPMFADDDELTLEQLQREGGLLTTAGWKDALDRLPEKDVVYIESVMRNGRNFKDEPNVHLSTIHAVKGGEADHVVIMPDMAKRTFDEAQQNRDSEHRVWYVAVTRAKKKLTIMNPRTAKHYPL